MTRWGWRNVVAALQEDSLANAFPWGSTMSWSNVRTRLKYFIRTGFLYIRSDAPYSVGSLGPQSTLMHGEHRGFKVDWRRDRHGFAFSNSSCTARANVFSFRRARPRTPFCRSTTVSGVIIADETGTGSHGAGCHTNWQCGLHNCATGRSWTGSSRR